MSTVDSSTCSTSRLPVVRNATFVLFKAQDFYWLTILLLCLPILFPFSFLEAFFFGGKRGVLLFLAVKLLFVIMRCAERKGGTSMMLWQHEFFMVIEPSPRGPPKPYVYQALEFRVGVHLPEDEVERMVRNQQKEVWGCGVAYAPALVVRKLKAAEMKKGYLFHTEWNDGDADKSLFGECPELVRVDNCTAWRPMSSVLNLVPRVVHFSDVKAREIHVAGRDFHFVCGVSSTEYVDHFGFKKIPRKNFCMYPEEVLGAGIQSATIMWERVEALFQGIREVMVKSGNARSGSFSMP